MKAICRVASIHGDAITLRENQASEFRPGDRLRFTPIRDGNAIRVGGVTVTAVDEGAGVLYTDVPASVYVMAVAEDDWICVERAVASDDIAAVETYLASCVRRRDWHGVSDAANDLRVLEAIREARR